MKTIKLLGVCLLICLNLKPMGTNEEVSSDELTHLMACHALCTLNQYSNNDGNNSANQDNNYSCFMCYKIYSSYRNLKRHTRNVHLQSRFRCEICKKNFKEQIQLTLHVQENHTEQDQ